VTEYTEVLCGKACRKAQELNWSIGILCVCVYVRVCFNGPHKFAVYVTNVGGFVRSLESASLKRKINLFSSRNASQLCLKTICLSKYLNTFYSVLKEQGYQP
jgi:hypothetical protein